MVCCSLTLDHVDGRPQFTNLRVFNPADLLAKDFWRSAGSLKSTKSNDAPDEDLVATGRSGASPIKRVSIATLLQHLQQVGQTKAPTLLSKAQDDERNVHVKVETEANSWGKSSKSKDSTIRRIIRPTGAVVYSRNLNGQASGQNILVKINPHLTESSTTSTTTASTTTSEPPTTTTTTTTAKPVQAREESLVKTLRPYQNIIGKKKSEGLVKASEGEKKLRANSPIYYIKLPPSAFVPTAADSDLTGESMDNEKALKEIVYAATTARPGLSSTTAPPADLSTTTLRAGLTNSRIIRLKGPFVFNGKPGGIYSAPAPYRPPNYWDILHSIYPKLRRAQFIRR